MEERTLRNRSVIEAKGRKVVFEKGEAVRVIVQGKSETFRGMHDVTFYIPLMGAVTMPVTLSRWFA